MDQLRDLATALAEHVDASGKLACFENVRPLVDECVERGLLKPVSGEFRARQPLDTPTGERLNLLGVSIPFGQTLYSVYRTTPLFDRARS